MYIDIDILRSYFFKDKNSKVAEKILKFKEKFITSVIVLEQLTMDLKKAKKDVTNLEKLLKLKNLVVVPLERDMIIKAMELMREYKLTVHQAINAATCLTYGEKLLSFDRSFDKIPNIRRIDPYSLVTLH